MADGVTPLPPTGPHPEIPDQPPPQDPTQFADYWRHLSRRQKNYLYNHDHNIGNHPGMPPVTMTIPARITTTGCTCPSR